MAIGFQFLILDGEYYLLLKDTCIRLLGNARQAIQCDYLKLLVNQSLRTLRIFRAK